MSKYIEVHAKASGNRLLFNRDKIAYFAEGKDDYSHEPYCDLQAEMFPIRVTGSYEQIKEMLNE